jgi:hypothetical protein
MFGKKTVWIFLIPVLGLASVGLATHVVIVTDNPEHEAGYEPFLKTFLGDEVTVDITDEKYRDPLSNQAKQDLEAADLIIVSRRTSSGSYSADIAFWNGLKTPILLQSAYISRESVWKWLPGDQHDADGLTHVAAVDEEHLVFTDVTLVDGQVQIFSEPIENTDVSDQASAGNGTKIATPAGVDDVMIASWQTGAEYYPGSGQVAGGPRMVFLMLRPYEFFPTLTPDGHKMLENCILILLGQLRKDAELASAPYPADMQSNVPRDGVVLAWAPGEDAAEHDLYVGTRLEDVGEATPADAAYMGRQSATTYALDRLDLGATCYWRIDEIGAAPERIVSKGHVWRFEVEPVGYPLPAGHITATASSSESSDTGPRNTIDGSGLLEGDLHATTTTAMWLSAGSEAGQAWIQYDFDKPYKLHQMLVWNYNGESLLRMVGMKAVAVSYSEDGDSWTPMGAVSEFAQAPGTTACAPEAFDFDGLIVKHVRIVAHSNWSPGGIFDQYGLSEVRFLYIPLRAHELSPAQGSTNIDPAVVLRWRTGREAGAHEVSLGHDPQDLALADVATGSPYASYDTAPLDLKLNETYYWQVTEVNETTVPSHWAGEVLRFTTKQALVVDDMEAYRDEASKEIWATWMDGSEFGTDDPKNGSIVGANPWVNDYRPETEIVHTGNQSLPIHYNNTGGFLYSEVTNQGPFDFTGHGIQTLVLYFYGQVADLDGRLYIRINDEKIVYELPADTEIPPAWVKWNQWNVDLTALHGEVSNVTPLIIGVEGAGMQGTLYVDDILLYAAAPPQPRVAAWFEAEAAATLSAPLEIMDQGEASGGKYIGTLIGVGDANNEPPLDGIATYSFSVAGGTYQLSARVNTEAGNSFWVRIPGAVTPADTELHASGWVRWNDPPVAEGWNWFDVFSDDDDQEATVLFTLEAGSHTLEIARREDGAWLDAIALMKVD